MVRVLITYEREPDAESYARHVADYASKVPRATFRHGKVFGNPFGEPAFAYVAEWEFEDMDAFKEGARSEPFNEAGRDAREMGVPFQVHFAEIE
jgi:heme-degrading monooxygenase HmoA